MRQRATGGHVREMKVRRWLFGFVPYTTIHAKPHIRPMGDYWICCDHKATASETGLLVGCCYASTTPLGAWKEWARWRLI